MVALKPSNQNELGIHDIFVFAGLELLGTLAVTGNICLITVLLRNKYLNRASFILMLSLACADVLHGICTTCYFYPPIVLRETVHEFVVRIFNIIDWTAWSITLTHMSAICLDRLIAIMLYGRYNQIITVKRMRVYSISCWTICLAINIFYFAMNFCCLIRPLSNSHYYTFGYDEEKKNNQSFLADANIYMYTYTPLEIITLATLTISNPITLVQLYRRHKRKIALRQHASYQSVRDSSVKTRSQWQRASTMLLEMSIRMGSKQVTNDVREMASRRANRQQQRILLQISVVAVIFYCYMTTYYTVYYIFKTENKWVMLFNSFFYSTTHMINPVIYFSLNKEMRSQLVQALTDLLAFICCAPPKARNEFGSLLKPSMERKTSCKMENSYTETSPLFSYTNNNKNSNNGVAATINRLQKESFATSLTQIVDAVSEQQKEGETIETKISEEIEEIKNVAVLDPQDVATAQEQRRTLLDALIKALTNFTSQFSEEEDAEVVTAVIKSHLRRFHSSRSYECLRSECHENTIRTSATLQNFVTNGISIEPESTELVPFLSPASIIKSPESYHTSSEQESSNSERMNAIKNSYTWQQWSSLKRNELIRGEETRESITMLLSENSDDEDVIYL